VISALLIAFNYNTYQSRVASHIAAEQELILSTYQTVIDSFKYQSEILYINRIKQPSVIQILKQVQGSSPEKQEQLRQALYDNLIDMYQAMQHFELKQLHFHLPNNHSFLRFHRPDTYGDDLTNIRQTIMHVNQTHQKVEGFEEGRIYNGYRFVFPLFEGPNYLGSVETPVSMAVILNEIHKNLAVENDFIIQAAVVNAKVFQSEQANYQATTFDANYLHEANIHSKSRPLINHLMQQYLKEHPLKGQNFTSLQVVDGKFYLLTGIAVPNAISHETVAYILNAREHKDLAQLHQEHLLSILAILLIVFIFIKVLHHTQQQKHALQHEQTIHQRIEAISALGSWEIDFTHNTMTWSQELFKLLGYSQKDTQPNFELLMNRVHPEDRQLLLEVYQMAVHDHKELSLEHRILRADGIIRTVKHTISHHTDAKGTITSSIGMLLDMSDLKLFEIELEKARNSFENLLKNIPEIIYRANCDLDRTVQYINDAVLQNLGYEASLFKYNQVKSLNSLIHKADLQRYLAALEKTLNEETSLNIEYRMLNQQGEIVWVHELTQVNYDENGCHLEGLIQNRTKEKQAQENLQKIIDLQDNIVILTNGQTISFANKSFFKLFIFDNLETFLRFHDCICDFFIPQTNFFSLENVPSGQLWTDVLLKLPASKRVVLIKNQYTQQLHAYSVYINAFDTQREIIVLTDVTDTIQEIEKLRQAAQRDALTGLYNRNFILNNFTLLTKGAKAKNLELALILFDIDHFKEINDHFGHNCGDEVLKKLTLHVSQTLRTSDVLVRWGGEEFIVLSEVTHLSHAQQLAEHLRLAIADISFDCTHRITSSFGVTLHKGQEAIKTTIERADKALYKAKNNGRNQVYTLNAKPEEKG
ncbi:MAG: diguanylate cyclase, partial [Thiotrichales bacterium]|nr:diguanylate cyclase [Thiotrichales bacterium]